MPPFVARKRRLSTPSSEHPIPKKVKKLTPQTETSPATASIHDKKKFLDSLAPSDEDSSLSNASSSEFEDVLPKKKRTTVSDESEEDDTDWEDALASNVSAPMALGPEPSGNLELTLTTKDDSGYRFESDKKKGPSKIEKKIRVATHCMHVQFLMFHNAIRNAWVGDREVQRILVEALPRKMKEQVERWKTACGDKLETSAASQVKKGKRKQTSGKGVKDIRAQRDWGPPAQRLEVGAPDLSHGDPTISLLRHLATYWRKNFTVTAPGLRKQGYKAVRTLEEEISSFHKDKHDHEEHGERIASLDEFRLAAKACEGSRDVGAQLFTALVRGLGIDARLVANLQPVGFGWSKTEEAPPTKGKAPGETNILDLDRTADGDDGDTSPEDESSPKAKEKSSRQPTKRKGCQSTQNRDSGGRNMPIDLSDTSELSDVLSVDSPSDADSVIDITPVLKKKPNKKYDRDLVFPVYWTEVISPISRQVYPVDPMVLQAAVAATPEQLSTFEPRGAKAEKARQIMAYVIAHSSDGTAKDVTVRYLRKHMWPGKTKAYRMPVEKAPIYNKRGKIRRYEEYDWFKTVISGYTRHSHLRTPADDIEDETDLKPLKAEKKAMKEGEETLQGYKQSTEFVLERHLRREEALLEGAEPVRAFKSGRGDKEKEEPVFLRKDVVACKTEESWHKEGRQVKPNEVALKHVPIRAVTLTRKREMEDMTRRNDGVKPMQGLYSKVQTEWIIPPPIKDGVIPKNKYGNMDCFVPSMVPEGAIHVPLRGTVRVCKKLGIDYAEAVTGFEFGNKMAVPVCQGVIVAVENEDALIDAWEHEEEIRKLKEDEKKAKLILGTWRKFLMGLRIVERVREEYGEELGREEKDSINPFTNQRSSRKQDNTQPHHINDRLPEANEYEGGFVRDDRDEVPPIEDDFKLVDPSKDSDTGDLVEIFSPGGIRDAAKKQMRHRSMANNDLEKTARNDMSVDTDDESSLLSTPDLASDSSSGESAFYVTNSKATPNTSKNNTSTPQPQSRRAIAARSTTRARSRYFEQEDMNSDDDDDDDDDEDRKEKEGEHQESKIRKKRGRPASTAKRGQASTAGTGPKNRGRGRPRKTMINSYH